MYCLVKLNIMWLATFNHTTENEYRFIEIDGSSLTSTDFSSSIADNRFLSESMKVYEPARIH